jgi:hypothetical protein
LVTDPYIVAPVITYDLDGDSGQMLAATSAGVLRSVNGGVYWSRTTGIPSGTSIQKIKFGSAMTAWASSFSSVFKSIDGGMTWVPLDTGNITAAIFDLTLGTPTTDVAYVSTVNDVFRTTNGGSSWERLTALSGGGDVPRVLAERPNSIFVGTGGIVRHSSDGGSTWVLLPRAEGVPVWSGLRQHHARNGIVLGATYDRGLLVLTPASDLSIVVSGAASSAPAPGNQVAFEVSVTNSGPYETTETYVEVKIPQGRLFSEDRDCHKTSPGPVFLEMRCFFGTLAPGATRRATIASSYETAADIDLSATVASLLQADADLSNNTTRVVVGYSAAPTPPATKGGGGGGSISLWFSLLLLLGALMRSQRSSSRNTHWNAWCDVA